jgi:hypothetical protein
MVDVTHPQEFVIVSMVILEAIVHSAYAPQILLGRMLQSTQIMHTRPLNALTWVFVTEQPEAVFAVKVSRASPVNDKRARIDVAMWGSAYL